MSLKNKIVVGLADEEVGSRVANVISEIAAEPGKIGFLGAAATAAQGVTLNNVTSVAQALINLGLAVENS